MPEGSYFRAHELDNNLNILGNYCENYAIVCDESISHCYALIRVLNCLPEKGWRCISLSVAGNTLYRMYALIERIKKENER